MTSNTDTLSMSFDSVLSTATAIADIISQWDEEAIENWVNTYNYTDTLLTDWGFNLVMHPGFATASPADQAAAYSAFDKLLTAVESYASPLVLESFIYRLPPEGVLLVAEHITEIQAENISPVAIGDALIRIVDTQFNPPYDPITGNPVDVAQIAADAARDFMAKLGDHINPAYVTQALQAFSYGPLGANLEGIDAITDNISDSLAFQLDQIALGDTLLQITNVQFNPPYDPATGQPLDVAQMAADAARDFMAKLGDHINPAYVTQALQAFSYGPLGANLEGIDAITDNISDSLAFQLDQIALGDVLIRIVDTQFNPPYDPATGQPLDVAQMAADAARDFMAKLGDHINPAHVAQALQNFAYGNIGANLEGIDAITDNISDSLAFQLDQIALGDTLLQITNVQFNPPYDPATGQPLDVAQMAADAARDFMAKLGDHINPAYVTQALQAFSYGPLGANLEGIDAITDNISDSLAFQLDQIALGDTLLQITNVQFNPPYDPATGQPLDVAQMAADAARDFMAKLGDHINPAHVAQALQNFAYGNIGANLEGIDAITDNISATLADQLDHAALGDVLTRIAMSQLYPAHDPITGQPLDAAQIAADATQDFMAKLGDHIDAPYIEQALQIFAYGPQGANLEGIDAIVSNIDDGQLSQISSFVLDDLHTQHDIFLGTDRNDFFYGGMESIVYGRGGDDLIIGQALDAKLFGGDGNDRVYDFSIGGDATLYGGDGSDYLYGGQGADTFVFKEGETGVDTVLYFNANEGDRLDLSDYLDGYDPTQQALDEFVILTDNGNNTVTVSVDMDGPGAGAAQDVAILLRPLSDVTIVEDIVDMQSLL